MNPVMQGLDIRLHGGPAQLDNRNFYQHPLKEEGIKKELTKYHYYNKKDTYALIRKISDDICREYGLEVLEQ